jgi:hypothetical protein
LPAFPTTANHRTFCGTLQLTCAVATDQARHGTGERCWSRVVCVCSPGSMRLFIALPKYVRRGDWLLPERPWGLYSSTSRDQHYLLSASYSMVLGSTQPAAPRLPRGLFSGAIASHKPPAPGVELARSLLRASSPYGFSFLRLIICTSSPCVFSYVFSVRLLLRTSYPSYVFSCVRRLHRASSPCVFSSVRVLRASSSYGFSVRLFLHASSPPRVFSSVRLRGTITT